MTTRKVDPNSGIVSNWIRTESMPAGMRTTSNEASNWELRRCSGIVIEAAGFVSRFHIKNSECIFLIIARIVLKTYVEGTLREIDDMPYIIRLDENNLPPKYNIYTGAYVTDDRE
jgi:hypothetical protein